MQLGDMLLNISSFLGTLWNWVSNLFTYQFTLGGLSISLWTVFVGIGAAIFITIFIINIFS